MITAHALAGISALVVRDDIRARAADRLASRLVGAQGCAHACAHAR
ncbi:MAG: hypothetical protein H0W83_03095 [Planctomycetes bacterium]|nr:hypothetical protein [Planctomycetota bacterium]